MISAALRGELKDVSYRTNERFGLLVPESCPGVPSEVLDPKTTWEDRDAYDIKAQELAKAFVANFENYADKANEEILNAAPKV